MSFIGLDATSEKATGQKGPSLEGFARNDKSPCDCLDGRVIHPLYTITNGEDWDWCSRPELNWDTRFRKQSTLLHDGMQKSK